MFNSMNRASAYARVGRETGVAAADPHRLVMMLFDGAIMAISTARAEMLKGEIAAKGNAISKAIEIIVNGLQVSLDLKSGGELAERLAALYEYMSRRLIHANLHNDQEALNEVADLLSGLRESWEAISPTRATQDQPQEPGHEFASRA